MKNDFLSLLKWRGMLQDHIPGFADHLSVEMRSAYIGFDPTSDSLHIGNLVPIMLLAHFQKCGHRPIVLIGGATGMIGDPSGKNSERILLDGNTLAKNQKAIKHQLSRFLDFDKSKKNSAIILNNYNWMKDFSFIDFTRSVGKHITVNYMMAKDSVKNRISSENATGMSFTEFTYQLIQGYDFLHLFKSNNCTIQMGGSDQWGNITTGVELVRRVLNGKGYAITCPLITKSDGSKFGKTEEGNIWLCAERTSPYKFYQYWLNSSDVDAEKYIRIFTFLKKDDIDNVLNLHKKEPHLRLLQNRLAREITALVHSKNDLINAEKASKILFSKDFKKDIQSIDKSLFLDIFEGVPTAQIPNNRIKAGLDMISVLFDETKFLSSRGDARRALNENSIMINKEKVDENYRLTNSDLINDSYIVINRGKRKTFIIQVI
ncbi:MAG: tyrosine--tRNA ligase [Flavobacteriaceae bacterium]|nr:tyrosine--tRNA ligase [Flavobacteriaceae bacterium]